MSKEMNIHNSVKSLLWQKQVNTKDQNRRFWGHWPEARINRQIHCIHSFDDSKHSSNASASPRQTNKQH